MKCLTLLIFTIYFISAKCFDTQYIDFDEDYLLWPEANWSSNKNTYKSITEKVKVQLFYEVFCPHCRTFDTQQFRQVVEKLSPYLDIKTYPYGNAKTVEKNGLIEFVCQHGPVECYGNKIHACALDLIKNQTAALIFNTCLMEYSQSDRGSDDNAADKCAAAMSLQSSPIKLCAKGKRGTELLKYYGKESKKANFQHVPYILINGIKNNGQNFMRDVCAAFTNPPPQCSQ